MGFVECIGSKGTHFIKNLVRDFFRNAVSDCARKLKISVFVKFSVDEVFPFLRHNVKLFFAHGTAHKVCASIGITRKLADYLHNLLLIHDTAVSYVQYRLQKRRFIRYLLRMMAVFKVFRNGIHGTRAIE